MAQEEIMHVPMAHAQVETYVATDEAAMIQIFFQGVRSRALGSDFQCR